ncbi:hypothetical protein A3F03_04195 [Candidatus Roizmanbacteria bacterium RIFCSPHIGHO2_12_FULL_41_11]|uniref:Prolipoprotein diacylglyceryl transferase n=3 Tax=Candidatus Roizmaniibacteriota TaxID=1752723 RepID=A0A1F7JRB9_9BACT|nr:MAG: hypothetical protein A3F03_04195 [Candidatus Roizmanbacteria bacterium RIFCSPHIGHO2_12_FULL_41_11]OGK51008.1 MAG: hypothetical protein A2966_02770 [Candidatus Roizmanbacteria bacterium RIFCSPLOWO2_01_FULL_41_22]OGK58147.1 MAG: hypothetical protein A3H86_04125 [Candidatus Roizmanbacteria bacterium RIFCSPLOWO2_02_FULL_41_9]
MLPILLDLKLLKIYTFGLFALLAFFWGSYFVWKNIQLTSYKEEDVFDCLFLGLFGGLFFGRLIYVILNFSAFGFDILKFILINGYPGINIFGVLIGAFVTVYLFTKIKKIGFWELMDYLSSPLLLAMGIIKIGAFFSGVEVGTKTAFFLSVKYVGYDGYRHLTPLYQGVLFLIGSYLVFRLVFEIRKQKYFHGFAYIIFWWLTSLILVTLENLRINKAIFWGNSFDFIVSFLILLTLSIYLVYYLRNNIFRGLASVIHLFKIHGRKKDSKNIPGETKKTTS